MNNITFHEIVDNHFIAIRNYNVKHMQWESRSSSRGREHFKATDTMNLLIVSAGEPTYWPTDSKEIPNLLVLRGGYLEYL